MQQRRDHILDAALRLTTQAQLERLSQLSKVCGGWIVFDQEREETFVALAEWEALYGKWRSA